MVPNDIELTQRRQQENQNQKPGQVAGGFDLGFPGK
jgi:hypothetical protein